MRTYNLTALVALTFLNTAGYGSSGLDGTFAGAGSEEIAVEAPATHVSSLSEEDATSKHAKALEPLPESAPTLPLAGYPMPPEFLEWLGQINPRISIKLPEPGIEISFDDVLNIFIQSTITEVPLTIPSADKYSFGFSKPFSSKSGVHRIIAHMLNDKLTREEGGTLNVLNLGAGHGVFELQLFMKDANIFCHSMEFTPELVELFSTRIKPMLKSINEVKAKEFMMLQGDVKNPDHSLFTMPIKRDMITAFNLFHYLDVTVWSQVLQNIYSALKPDGFAVFSVNFNEHNGLGLGTSQDTHEALFPEKRKPSSKAGFLDRTEENHPGTKLPDGSLIGPYIFNLPQVIHCVEHTGLYKVEFYVIMDREEKIISRKEALKLARDDMTSSKIFVIARPVSLATLVDDI